MSLSGCIFWDTTNDGELSITIFDRQCENGSVDVNFDERNPSTAVSQKLNEIVDTGYYSEDAEYSSATLEIYNTLDDAQLESETEGRPTLLYNGSCYGYELERSFDD
ncbi:hypothetical protein [Halostella litorea]|uniref:hypothetical protein n=1 Tax=Halostella litorea TaxID=2528831 RepID=UPI001091BC77|nr:hypothetical protein [Halostella litorea]